MNKQIKQLTTLFLMIVVCFTILIITNKSTQTPIVNEKTGVVLKEKISCMPKDEYTKQLYLENGISLNGLPECKDYKINGVVTSKDGIKKDSGLFTLIFVRPLTFLLIKIGLLFNNYFYALLILIFIKSLFILRNNYKMAKNNKKIKALNKDIKEISAKYEKKSDFWSENMPYNENLARINYANDIKMLYKKHGINPVSGCIIPIIQIPILIAFITILYTVPAILETNIFGISLGSTYKTLFYTKPLASIILIITFALCTILNNIISAENKFNLTKSNIIITVIVTILLLTTNLPIGVTIYFILGDIFNVIGKLIINKKMSKDD